VSTAVAVVLALCAALCFALGSLVQQGEARQAHGRSLRLGLLVVLARDRRWLGGLALTVFSFGVQAAALAFGPLALVQPLATLDVLFALPLIAHRNRRPLTRRSIVGGACVAAGMAAFVAVSPPTNGVGTPGLASWVPALAGAGALTALAGVAALRARGPARVMLLAAAAAVVYGVLDALTKATVDMLPARGVGVLASWEPYGLAVAGILGGLFGQSAFNAGALALSLPVVDTVEPAAAVVLAAAVFHEGLARSPGQFAGQLAGAATAVAGIALLSHSCVVLAEDRRAAGLAGLATGPASAAGTAPACEPRPAAEASPAEPARAPDRDE
jgi:drug/metabolite transporter (DMT)-like permease